MDETQIRTLEDVERFSSGICWARPLFHGDKEATNAWIERTLVRFGYMELKKKGKGIVRRYIVQLSGYSRQQTTRLIAQYRKSGHLRRRHSNDNALAESKNNCVVRKTFGHTHIPQKHAELMEEFNRKVLDPCLNYHRPCHFPTVETDSKGKRQAV